jgi:hypothetical protein
MNSWQATGYIMAGLATIVLLYGCYSAMVLAYNPFGTIPSYLDTVTSIMLTYGLLSAVLFIVAAVGVYIGERKSKS